MLDCECPNETRRDVQLVATVLLRHPPTCRLRNELLTLSVEITSNSQCYVKPNAINMSRLAAFKLSKGHQLFQKAEGSPVRATRTFVRDDWRRRRGWQPKAVTSLFATAGQGGGKHREAASRGTHLTWVTACVILLLTVQLLCVSKTPGAASYPGAEPIEHLRNRAGAPTLEARLPTATIT